MTLTQVNEPKEAFRTSSYEGWMLNLPTGQILWGNSQVKRKEVSVYTPQGAPNSSWLPVVSSVANTLTVGSKANAI